MKKSSFFLTLLLITLIISCSKDEQTINSPTVKWRLLVSAENQPRLELTSQPEGSVTIADVYLANNGKILDGQVMRMAEYGKNLFLFIPSKYKIEVINNETFKSIAVFDFSSSLRVPSAICFANSSSAYICFGNDSTVDLLDMEFMKIARTVKVGKNPVSIACAGNQVFVANRGDNTVSVIDTRDNEVKSTLNVAPKPSFVDVSKDAETALVISLGEGKLDTTQTKTSAQLTVFNVNTKAVIKNKFLGTSEADAIKQMPRGITVNEKNMAFVPTATNLFRISTKTGDMVNISKVEHISVLYNNKRDELLLIRKKTSGTEIYTADPSNAAFKATLHVSADAITLLPLSD